MGYWDKKTKAAEPEELPLPTTLAEQEQMFAEDLGEVEKSFRERAKAEKKRFADMCDSEYWVCVCFTSRAQKEEFLAKIGMETDLKYIEGKEMARAFRKSIKNPDLEFAQTKGIGKDFLELSEELK